MTPKEKAEEIVDSYFTIIDGQVGFKLIKQCALIAVEYIYNQECSEFWLEVKQEIEKL